jgi:peroxiredoxin
MTASHSRKLIDRHALSFPLLQDPGNHIADRFGLRFTLPEDLQDVYKELGLELPRYSDDPGWTLPIPARYVVAADGTIVSGAVSADYRERPDPEETLTILRGLCGWLGG